MKIFLSSVFFLMCINVFGQTKSEDQIAIKQTITDLFDGMRQSDTSKMRNAMTPQAILQTINKNSTGKVSISNTDVQRFIASVAGEHPEYDERISFEHVQIDGELASVWTNYQFFVGGKFSHCGVNAFQLAKLNDSWKIIYIIDTRRKDNCMPIN